jgi:hypothetical protein
MTDSDTKALEKAKAELELEIAKAAAAKAERERIEAESPLAKAKRDADAQKGIDEAQQLSAEAQQKQVAALVPDLSKVTADHLEQKEGPAIFGPALAQRATTAAAVRAAQRVAETIGNELSSARILVTSDTALATSDAAYIEVSEGLDALIEAAKGLLEFLGADEEATGRRLSLREPSSDKKSLVPAVGVAPIFKALAAAVPGALSLLTAHRTLSTSTVTVDSLAAAAAAAGELVHRPSKPTVFHDEFRLPPMKGEVQDKAGDLATKRKELVERKVALEDEKSTKSADLAKLKAEIKQAEDELMKTKEAKRAALRTTLDSRRDEAVAPEVEIAEKASRIALIDSAISGIDIFTTAMKAVADGATRSPLAAAILREQLHGGGDDAGQFTHVLLIKAETGGVQQLIDDRPLWWKDKFTTIATSNVTYMLIETKEGSVIRSGSIGGEAKVQGTIGTDITVVAAEAMAPTT